MQTRSINSKNLGKDEKNLTMENYLTVTATINYIARKLNLKIKNKKFVKKIFVLSVSYGP